eukprot:360443-Chlamydomonas_euryale.AAC.7
MSVQLICMWKDALRNFGNILKMPAPLLRKCSVPQREGRRTHRNCTSVNLLIRNLATLHDPALTAHVLVAAPAGFFRDARLSSRSKKDAACGTAANRLFSAVRH